MNTPPGQTSCASNGCCTEVLLEQRIGRLDRIGRESDVPIYYSHNGGDALFASVYERVGIFADASIGSSPSMAHLRDALRERDHLDEDIDALQREVAARVAQEGGHWAFPDSHTRDENDAILEEIPEDLDDVLQRFCVDAAERIGMDVVAKDGAATYYFEYGTSVEVETIPGLPVGSRYLGTFDRRRAIENEALDFFANGHPLVEGLLAELEDSPRGRVGAIRLPRRQSDTLHGLYLLILEGRDTLGRPRLLPLMHAGDTDFGSLDHDTEANRLYDALDLGIALPDDRVGALMQRVANQPVLQELDASAVVQAILVAVMD